MKDAPADDSAATTRLRAIGANVRRYRRQAGKTQAELGAAVHRSEQTVKEIEAGRRKRLNSAMVDALAAALSVEPWQIDPERLGDRVASAGLTPEQQDVVAEILTMGPDDFEFIRHALAKRGGRRKP